VDGCTLGVERVARGGRHSRALILALRPTAGSGRAHACRPLWDSLNLVAAPLQQRAKVVIWLSGRLDRPLDAPLLHILCPNWPC